jgi:hypothetical protein
MKAPMTIGPEREWTRVQISAPNTQGVVGLDFLRDSEFPVCIHLTSENARELGRILTRAADAVLPTAVPPVVKLLLKDQNG